MVCEVTSGIYTMSSWNNYYFTFSDLADAFNKHNLQMRESEAIKPTKKQYYVNAVIRKMQYTQQQYSSILSLLCKGKKGLCLFLFIQNI